MNEMRENCCGCFNATTEDKRYPMKREEDEQGGRLSLRQVFLICTSVDTEALFICEDCHQYLIQAYQFREMALETQQLFESVESCLLEEAEVEIVEEKYSPSQDISEEVLEEFYEIEETVVLEETDEGWQESLVEKENIELDTIVEVHEIQSVQKPELTADPEETVPDSYDCSHCRAKFGDPESLSEHAQVHVLKPYTCDLCGRRYDNFGALRYHICWKHLNMKYEKPKSFECEFCGKEYKREISLRMHLSKEHDQGVIELPFRCRFCDAHLRTIASRTLHEKTSHKAKFEKLSEEARTPKSTFQKAKSFSCPHCPKQYEAYINFNLHMNSKHLGIDPKNGNKVYACHLCPKIFSRINYLKDHLNEFHEVGDNGNFSCNKCKEVFRTLSYLRRHLKHSHQEEVEELEESLNQCHICLKVFRYEIGLKHHMNEHHGMGEDEKQVCLECSKQFRTLFYLRQHVEKVHVKKRPSRPRQYKKSPKVSVFYCDVPNCGKSFLAKRNLVDHQASAHSGSSKPPKRYSCQICGSSYARQSSLSVHKRTHKVVEGDAWECEYCREGFPDGYSLRLHTKIMHPKVAQKMGLMATSYQYTK